MKVAIVVGHNSAAQGASSLAPINQSEFVFNNMVADQMIVLASGSGINLKKFNRTPGGGYSNEIRRVYREVEQWGARAAMELHFNSSPGASGTLMLHSGSENSRRFAEITQQVVLQVLQLQDRGARRLGPGDRGYSSVVASSAWTILTEPFFGSSASDCARVGEIGGVAGVAQMYFDAITQFAGTGAITPPVIPAAGATDDLIEVVDFVVEGKTKQEFFAQNKAKLAGIVAKINEGLESDNHGEPIHRLTMLDVVCICNAEFGLKGDGTIDTKHTHSLGERGALPLPSNIRYWNGESSPESTQLVSAERNIKEFLLYLGNLKNRDVGKTFTGGSLYEDLFTVDDIASDEKKQMFVLAACIHGWFYRRLYTNDIPYLDLVRKVGECETNVNGVISFLQTSGYAKAQDADGRSILKNRINNLIDGIAIHDTL